jgi:hypothetical protein
MANTCHEEKTWHARIEFPCKISVDPVCIPLLHFPVMIVDRTPPSVADLFISF